MYNFNSDEINKRAGYKIVTAEYIFFKCPSCQRIYLYETDTETFYVNPDNFQECHAAWDFKCVECGYVIVKDNVAVNGLWFDGYYEPQDTKFYVSEEEVLKSKWNWMFEK